MRTVGVSADRYGRAALAACPGLTRAAELSVHPCVRPRGSQDTSLGRCGREPGHRERLLHREHGCRTLPRGRERSEEAIAERVQLAAVMGRQGGPDQLMMLGQNLRADVLPDAPQQCGRGLDIGE